MKRKLIIVAAIGFAGLVLFVLAVAISSWMIQSRVPVSILNSLTIDGGPGYASATGTMVIEGDRGAMPLQTTEIKCTASNRLCILATATIIPPKGLYVMADSFPVSEWTDSHLVFGEDGGCVTNTFTINWVSKSVTGIRLRNKIPKPGMDCSAILSDELRMSLRSGIDVWREEERRAYPAFIRILVAVFSLWGDEKNR